LKTIDTLVGLAGSVPRMVREGAAVRDQPLPKGAGEGGAAERAEGPAGVVAGWLSCRPIEGVVAAPPPLPATVMTSAWPVILLTRDVEQVEQDGQGRPSQPPVSGVFGLVVAVICP